MSKSLEAYNLRELKPRLTPRQFGLTSKHASGAHGRTACLIRSPYEGFGCCYHKDGFHFATTTDHVLEVWRIEEKG